MASKALTPISIENMKAGATRREIPDGKSRGLYLVVQPSGRKSFALRYRRPTDGKPAKLTIGNGSMTLATARRAAAEAFYEVEQGRDPAAAKGIAKAKAAAAAADTLQAICEEYLKREGKRLRTADWREKVLSRLVYPKLGSRPIIEIRRTEVVRLLDQIEDENGATMADRTLAVIRKIMNWHASRSDDFRSPIVRGMARVKSKERARERTLSDDELRSIWKAAEAAEGPFGSFVRFLLLSAARRSEAAGMRWSELEGADWTLPGARNKTKLDLVRPLSGTAQAVLAAIPGIQDCEFVFSTDGKRPIGGFSKFKRSFDKVSGVTGWTLHDLRRTARSLMSRTGVSSDHAERCLGHVMAGVRGTYDRHEYHREKQLAFEALAIQIGRIVNPTDNVTAYRRHKN
jgi:integrase